MIARGILDQLGAADVGNVATYDEKLPSVGLFEDRYKQMAVITPRKAK
jgi:hypothetical protein